MGCPCGKPLTIATVSHGHLGDERNVGQPPAGLTFKRAMGRGGYPLFTPEEGLTKGLSSVYPGLIQGIDFTIGHIFSLVSGGEKSKWRYMKRNFRI